MREAQVESAARVTWGESVARETPKNIDLGKTIIILCTRLASLFVRERILR